MKKYFFTGLILLLPIIITLYILLWIIDLFTEPFMGMVRSLLSPYMENEAMTPQYREALIVITSRVFILLFLSVFILILGFLCQKMTRNLTLNIFSRIPFVTSIYRVTREVTKAIIKPGEKLFKETVMVPFPNSDSYILGLVTGSALPLIQAKKESLERVIFVPTAPHPLSGYLIMTSKNDAIPVEISTEELFQFLLAAGAMNNLGKKPP